MIPVTHTLATIGLKPGITCRDQLTVTRRIARRLGERCEVIRAERSAMRREANKLRAHLPFTKRQVEELEQQASQHHAAELEGAKQVLRGFGYSILRDAEKMGFDALGLDALADLLNINRVDRERARREGWRTLSDLVAIHDLENSAERRDDRWGAGSPLYEACFLAMVEFIRTAPEGTLPDPFGPDGPFYGVPVRVLNADGTETVKRPDLVIHDANGSRVVKR
jgi:hypothetical protein